MQFKAVSCFANRSSDRTELKIAATSPKAARTSIGGVMYCFVLSHCPADNDFVPVTPIDRNAIYLVLLFLLVASQPGYPLAHIPKNQNTTANPTVFSTSKDSERLRKYRAGRLVTPLIF